MTEDVTGVAEEAMDRVLRDVKADQLVDPWTEALWAEFMKMHPPAEYDVVLKAWVRATVEASLKKDKPPQYHVVGVPEKNARQRFGRHALEVELPREPSQVDWDTLPTFCVEIHPPESTCRGWSASLTPNGEAYIARRWLLQDDRIGLAEMFYGV